MGVWVTVTNVIEGIWQVTLSYLPFTLLCEKRVPVLEPNSFHFHKYNKNNAWYKPESKTGALLFSANFSN